MYKGLEYLKTLPEWSGSGTFSLDSISRVLRELGDPQDKTSCIHIAGTNGKGSVSAGLASILGACGLKIGLTTSPHLFSVEERVVIDGRPVQTALLDRYLSEVSEASGSCGAVLSYFEAVCAAAFLCFQREKVDWMVLETGLGGRLDATNVVKRPKATVITSIDFDHEQILGDTLYKIAKEKAGILKPGIPGVIGPVEPEALESIMQIAQGVGAPLHVCGRDFKVSPINGLDSDGRQSFTYEGQAFNSLSFKPALRGRHQGNNMAICLKVAELLGIGRQQALRGVENVFWPGRIEEVFVRGRQFIIDGGHNPAGIDALANYLESRDLQELEVGFGALDTKNWQAMVLKLIPYCRTWTILRPESSRAVEPAEIAEYLSRNGISDVTVMDSRYEDYLENQLSEPRKNPTLLAGSIYLIGKLRQMLLGELPALWRKD